VQSPSYISPIETVSQCHPDEAIAEGSRLCKWLEKADSSPEFILSIVEGAQNDIRLICALRHGLVAGEQKKEGSFLPNLIRHRLSYLYFTHEINQP
jgi:hypothetical protein